MNTKTDIRSTGEYQGKVDTFVYKEVLTSANELIQALSENEAIREGDYSEELIELAGSYDYEEPAIYEIENADNDDLQTYYDYYQSDAEITLTTPKELLTCLKDNDLYQDFCEYVDIKPSFNEVLEHWIVSDNLARHLRENDQIVIDIYGLTIWGRFTPGQAISMDSVICDIYDKING